MTGRRSGLANGGREELAADVRPGSNDGAPRSEVDGCFLDAGDGFEGCLHPDDTVVAGHPADAEIDEDDGLGVLHSSVSIYDGAYARLASGQPRRKCCEKSPTGKRVAILGAMPASDLTAVLDRLVAAGVAATSRALAEATPSHDLSFPQWRALLVVGEAVDGLTVSQVAARLGVTIPATSRQLHRLARRGLVEIRRDEADRRAARVRLTESGAAFRDAVLARRRQRIAALVGSHPVPTRALAELERIADTLDALR